MRHTRAMALPVLVGVALTLGACTSLKTRRFADDPTFPETASKIELTVHRPASVHATRTYRYTSERPEAGPAVERRMNITWDVPVQQLALGYESNEHTLVLVDHSSSRTYDVSGVTTVIRREVPVSERVSEETAVLVLPVIFLIQEDGQPAGHVTVTRSPRDSEIRFDIVFNGKPLRVQYGGSLSGARYFACEHESRLAAFAEFTYRGTTGSGAVLLRPDLVEGLEPAILASIVMADELVWLLDQVS